MLSKREKAVQESSTIDLISKLPSSILHHVLTSLPPKDAARSAVLSTTWRSVWNSFPIILFDEFLFGMDNAVLRAGKVSEFLYFANVRLSHYPQNSGLSKFRLCMTLDEVESSSQVKRWIDFVLDAKVKELDLDLRVNYGNSRFYNLPLEVLNTDSIQLDGVKLDIESIQNLLSSCPVKELSINNCLGLEVFQIFSCSILKLELGNNRLSNIKIVAPNLDSLMLVQTLADETPSIIEALSCDLLRDLTLRGANIRSDWFENNLSNYPHLENLVLERCIMLKTLKTVNGRLKTIQLEDCNNLAELLIGTPLQTFIYSGMIPPFRPIIAS
ncbi:F-box domain [Dillenia turbinata]|uniref:F-box domain n=1 Tax=Dillenia turbinata TaxID=194707 RepID=A0AAN8V0B0_9MAGN